MHTQHKYNSIQFLNECVIVILGTTIFCRNFVIFKLRLKYVSAEVFSLKSSEKYPSSQKKNSILAYKPTPILDL